MSQDANIAVDSTGTTRLVSLPESAADATITGGRFDPIQAFTRMNSVLDAIMTSHIGLASGEERPAYAIKGLVWMSQTTDQLYLFDGTSDLEVAVNAGAPAASGDPGSAGQVAWDDDYFYVYTSGGWKRVALSTF